jgi:hypothetical protein
LPSGPIVDYDTHYRTHDVSPAQLLYDVRFLRQLKRMGEVEHALTAYLKYHGTRAEPWMYLLLAVTYEVNGRSNESVKIALAWAGFLARKQNDPFTLIEVADILMLRDIKELPLPNQSPPIRTGELLDQAHEKAPHRYEPILLSMLLAERSNDSERMARTVDNLLSVGWPGYDELWRVETRKRVDAMAVKLERDGKGDAAQTLRTRLEDSEQRDLFLRLTWKGDAGLELSVKEPLGATATVLEPRTVFGGAIVKAGRGKHPESEYVCPLGFSGVYEVRVESLYNNPKDPAREVKLEVITHEGTDRETHETQSIDPESTEPLRVTLEAGRRTRVLPFTAPTRLRVEAEELEESTEAAKNAKPKPGIRISTDPSDALRVPQPGEAKKRPTINPEPEKTKSTSPKAAKSNE